MESEKAFSQAMEKLEDEAGQLIIILWDVKKALDKVSTLLMVLIGTSGVGLAPGFIKNVSTLKSPNENSEFATPETSASQSETLSQSRKGRKSNRFNAQENIRH